VTLAGRRVVVTGAGGFIGSHLAERLVEAGADTVAFVEYDPLGSWGWLDESERRAELNVVGGDVRDRDTLREPFAGADVVFHLAALIAIPYSYRAPQSYVDTNVTGTANALAAARDVGVGLFVHTSTSEVYGTARRVPIDEEHPLQAQSPYAASKIGADKLAESFHLTYGLPVVTVRPFNTYGPRQSARAVIPTIVTQLLARDEVALGNTSPTRDFTFVEDVVDGFLAAAAGDAAVGEVVNLGSSKEISVADLAARIARAVRKEPALVHDDDRVRPAGSEVERLCADTSKAQRLLGWSPRVDLDTGLAATVEWIERNLDRYKLETYAT
jgi:NAD dependent epimerase/dehydratase